MAVLTVTVCSQESSSSASSAVSVGAPGTSEGDTVDLRHHWKRPYTYGYGHNYYGANSYPSYYGGGYGYSQQNYHRPSYSHSNYYPSYQHYYPSYGYGYGYGYNNYYSSSYQQYSGGNYYGLGYREGETNKNQEAPVQTPAQSSTGDEIKFN